MKRTIPPDWHLRSRLKARQLALLVAIAEHRSLRQAAQHIAVTQPAATRMLKELEDALGVPLFDRFAWGMQATPYGDTMIRYARGVLTDLSEARDEIAALASGAKGKLRIGSVTGAVPGLVAPALQSVRLGRPGLKVFVLVNTSDVLAAALRQGTLDVAIGQLPADAERGEFDTEPLRDEPLCLVARAGHPLARATTLDAASLSGIDVDPASAREPDARRRQRDARARPARAPRRRDRNRVDRRHARAAAGERRDLRAAGRSRAPLREVRLARAAAARLPRRGKRDGAPYAREPPARAGGPGFRGGAAESRAVVREEGGRDACSLPCDSCSDASQTWSTAMR